MATASLKAEIDRLRQRIEARAQPGRSSTLLDRLRADPAGVMAAGGISPDPWQVAFLHSAAPRVLLLTTRQAGKSTTAAALALAEALCRPASLVLMLSPSERQSGELATKVFGFYDALGQPVAARKRTELQLHLVNGSRVIALPESERTIRGYSGARLLIVDEAARVGDDLYRSVRPMLAVSRGRLVALSTPFGRRGWFWEEWDGPRAWERVKITADQCQRIDPQFLEEERRSIGDRWYRQEYLCSFEDSTAALFAYADLIAAVSPTVKPLTLPE